MLSKKITKNIALTFVAIVAIVSLSARSFAEESQDSQMDLCLNIINIQTEVPGGYHRLSESGDCIRINEDSMPTFQKTEVDEVVDVCPNLENNQSVVPEGYWRVDGGNCMKDVCPNIVGAQSDIPSGYKKTDGQCVKIVVPPVTPIVFDFCSNYDGIQKTIPPGFKRSETTGICVPKVIIENSDNKCPAGSWPVDGGKCKLDVCFNLRGAQADIPEGYEMKTPGQCTPKPKPVIVDFCSNMEGVQARLPEGYKRSEGSTICVKIQK